MSAVPEHIEISAGPCLPSLLRPEKMPGYANKQGAPALNAVNILRVCPMISFSSVSQASVNEMGAESAQIKYSQNIFNSKNLMYLIS